MGLITRRHFICIAGGSLAASLARSAFSQTYPSHPIRYIVGFAPGGTSDTVARKINPLLAEKLGQPLIIENYPSAGGVVATAMLSKAAPDGYMVLHTSNAFLTVSPHLIHVTFDPLQDVQPVAYLGSSVQTLCVHPQLPVNNVAEFIAYAKANPGKLNYGSSGTGTGNHITCEYFKRAAGFEAQHIPYKGAAPAIQDLIAGRIQFMTDPALIPYIQAKSVRALAVVDAERHPILKTLPPISATVANWNPPLWYLSLIHI